MNFKIKPQPYRPGASFLTLLEKEILRFKKIALQTIFAPVLMGLLYLLVFGQVLAGKMPTFDGVNYLHFLVPGLVMMTMLQNAFGNSSSSMLSSGRVRPRYHLDGGPQRFRHPRPGHALCRLGAFIGNDRRFYCARLNCRCRCSACFVPLVSPADGPPSLDFGLWVYGRRSYGVFGPHLRIVGR